MKNAIEQETQKLEVKQENIVRMPLGLLGFEKHKEYVLLAKTEEAPFSWLQMLEAPQQAFLVIPPSIVTDDYRPELSPEDVDFLSLKSPEDALILNIVTLHSDGKATVNLKGPIIINRHTLTGKQVIPVNAPAFALQHPVGNA